MVRNEVIREYARWISFASSLLLLSLFLLFPNYFLGRPEIPQIILYFALFLVPSTASIVFSLKYWFAPLFPIGLFYIFAGLVDRLTLVRYLPFWSHLFILASLAIAIVPIIIWSPPKNSRPRDNGIKVFPPQQDKPAVQKTPFSWWVSGQFNYWFWPSINDSNEAKRVSRLGIYAAVISGIMTIGMVFLRQHYLGGLFDGAITLIIGFGIYKIYRFAAILGLCYFIYGRIYFIEQGLPPLWFEKWISIAIAIALTLMYVNSIRGTFAYHKFKEEMRSKGDRYSKGVP